MIRQITTPETVTIVNPETGEPVKEQVGEHEDGTPQLETARLPFSRFVTVLLRHSRWKRDLDAIDLRRDVQAALRGAAAPSQVADVSEEAWQALCEAARDTQSLPWGPEVISQLADGGFFSTILEAPKKSAAESKQLGSGEGDADADGKPAPAPKKKAASKKKSNGRSRKRA